MDKVRLRRVERRLRTFYDPAKTQLDPAQVKASRDFHIEHWLRMAETVIRRDHQVSYYQGLSVNLESTLADHPQEEIPADLQNVLFQDLAFMEGHVQAFRYLCQTLEQARKQEAGVTCRFPQQPREEM